MNKDLTIKIWGNKMITFKDEKDEPDQSMRAILSDYIGYQDGYSATRPSPREPETINLLQEHIREGDVVVDVGASVGFITLELAKLVGKDGKVYSFEPTKNQFEYLKKNVKINGYEDRVVLHNVAAGEVNGDMRVRCNATSPQIQDCIKLDDVLPEKVNLIKIDVDGSEPKVLKGLIKTIERNKDLKLIIEFLPQYIVKLGNSVEEMIAILSRYFLIKALLDGQNMYLIRRRGDNGKDTWIVEPAIYKYLFGHQDNK